MHPQMPKGKGAAEGAHRFNGEINHDVAMLVERLESSVHHFDEALAAFSSANPNAMPFDSALRRMRELSAEILERFEESGGQSRIEAKSTELEIIRNRLGPLGEALDRLTGDSELLSRTCQVDLPNSSAVALPPGLSENSKWKILSVAGKVEESFDSVGMEMPASLVMVALLCGSGIADQQYTLAHLFR